VEGSLSYLWWGCSAPGQNMDPMPKRRVKKIVFCSKIGVKTTEHTYTGQPYREYLPSPPDWVTIIHTWQGFNIVISSPLYCFIFLAPNIFTETTKIHCGNTVVPLTGDTWWEIKMAFWDNICAGFYVLTLKCPSNKRMPSM
jgi:hypothetical protein